MMTVALVSLSLLSGVAFGFLYMGMENMKHLEWLITGALGILVMAAGIDIGINWSVVVKISPKRDSGFDGTDLSHCGLIGRGCAGGNVFFNEYLGVSGHWRCH